MMPGDKRIHRLEELLVEEVSIVDKPANKRRFLAVKSEDGMGEKGAEIVTDEAGNLVTDPAAAPATTDPDPSSTVTLKVDADGKVLSVVQEGAVPTPELAERFAAVGKSLVEIEKRLSIDPEMRRGIFRELGDVMGRVQSVFATADAARIDRGEGGGSTLVPVLGTELGEIAKVLSGLARRLSAKPAKKNDDDPTPEAKKGLEAVVQAVEAAVEKRGAKMGKGRLGKFREAMKVLQSILSELDAQAPGGAKPAFPGAKPPFPGAKPFPPKKPAKKADEAGVPEAVTKAMTSLTETVAKLEGIVKAQGKVIHDFRKRPGASNVITVDPERERVDKSDADETHWPLDMNDEKTRETVDKSVSFI